MNPEPLNDLSTAIVFVTIVLLLLAGALIFFYLWYQKKKELNKIKIEEMKLKSEQLETHYQQELLRTQLEIQEQTLKNISQEIHDNVGQVLSLAKLNLNTMDINKTEQLKGKIDNTLIQVSKAINDLRDISKSFNTDNIAAIGLIRAVEYELDMIRKTGSHKAIFEISGAVKKFEAQKELILFRIMQEILHNVIKHAEAGIIHVFATYTDKELELEITDDGKGFDPALVSNDGNSGLGLGIRNMQNRAKLIGAEFAVNSSSGKGTTVKIMLPFENNNVTKSK